jgi:hypothetical protein
MADERPSREDLLQAALGQETVTGVDIKKLLSPKNGRGQTFTSLPSSWLHCVRESVVPVEGEEKKTLNQGEAFYEQQNKTIYISTMPLRRRRLFLSHSI